MIPIEQLFATPEFDKPQVSPDGAWLAWLSSWKETPNLFIRHLSSETIPDRRLTEEKGRGVRFFFWRGDSRHLLYLVDDEGDEKYRFMQLCVHSGKTRDLTPRHGIKAELVAVDANYPDTLLVALNRRNPTLFDVYRLNLETGALELDTPNEGDVFAWGADNNMQIRACQAYLEDGCCELRVREGSGSRWKVLRSWSPDEAYGAAGTIGFPADNRSAYVLSCEGSESISLFVMDLSTAGSRMIAGDSSYDLAEVLSNQVTHAIEAVKIQKERGEWHALTDDAAKALALIRQHCRGDISITGSSSDYNHWIVRSDEDITPPCYFHYDRISQKVSYLGCTLPSLRTAAMAEMKPISFNARDGVELHGYLALPRDISPCSLPCVISVHGGPWTRDVWGFDSEVQWLAGLGFGVMQINFRGSTGYGRAHFAAGLREWGGVMHRDILDGRDWLIKEGYADPARIGIMGTSYGGYETLVALSFSPSAFACGVDLFGPSNLVTLLECIPYHMTARRAMYRMRIGSHREEKEFLQSRSPLFKADHITAPLFIAQGENDVRVRRRESEQIVQALKGKGTEVEYHLFRGEGHGFARQKNRLTLYRAVEDFLLRHLKP
ncbi:MAG: prolyl oligopeptidase family serine peptidase [Candidatus Xenobiia bacterium LiM19]